MSLWGLALAAQLLAAPVLAPPTLTASRGALPPASVSPQAAGGRALLLPTRSPLAQPTPLPGPVPLAPQALEQPRPLDRWWFWAAAGGLVLTTALLFVVVTSGDDQPDTRLGNMEAFD